MDTSSKKLVWAFAVLGCLSVVLAFYKSVIVENFVVVYCDEEDCYEEMTEEMLGEEGEDVMSQEDSLPIEDGEAGAEDVSSDILNTEEI